MLLSRSDVVRIFKIHENAKRSTTAGEYASLLKYINEKGGEVALNYKEFKEITSKPCKYCGGVTPGYEGNTLITPTRRKLYDEQCITVCWPCRNMLGFQPESRLDHVFKIADFLRSKKGD